MTDNKPFNIPKKLVWNAWHRVKAKSGSLGIDGIKIEKYEEGLKENLYKLWNRMSSGTYFPKPVKQVAIPKGKGVRLLGVPTVEDRIAQVTVLLQMESELESTFYDESYGARRDKSALQAVGECREHCWRYDYVIDLDLKSFFTTINHELLLKAVDKHAKTKWEKLYIRRWLSTPVKTIRGKEMQPEGVGIPQGGPISPALSNLFLHYGLDHWLKTKYPDIRFERYLDDVIIHCHRFSEAQLMLRQVEKRLNDVRLSLNMDKTCIAYCKTGKVKSPPNRQCAGKFTFLGFDFKSRKYQTKQGKTTRVFTPAVGSKGKQSLLQKIKKMKVMTCTHISIETLAIEIAPIVRGWLNYFKAFRPSEMSFTLLKLNWRIAKWWAKKHKRFRKAAKAAMRRLQLERPDLFPQWKLGYRM